MKCLILAAGYATRLYPLTENFPKPLLEVRGKTILDWLIDDIDSSGLVDEYIVVTNSRFAGIFNDWASARRASSKVTVLDDGTSSNETRLGAVKDMDFAIERLSLDEDLLVMAGDNLLNFSLVRFIEYFRSKASSCVMRFFQPDRARLHKSGVIESGQDDLVIRLEEKPSEPRSNWCCPPFYCLTAADVSKVSEAIAAGCGTDAPGSFIAWLVAQSSVYAMEMPGRRYDIGNVESYRKVCESYEGLLK